MIYKLNEKQGKKVDRSFPGSNEYARYIDVPRNPEPDAVVRVLDSKCREIGTISLAESFQL